MRAGRRLLAVADALPVTVLAVIAGAGSFTHIRDTAAQHGQTGLMASAVAVCVDLTCVMAARERQHAWGIGRHIQGSQVFDYWRDPFGNKIEHWTDGDLVNDATPTTHEPLTPDAFAQWAPPLSPDFLN